MRKIWCVFDNYEGPNTAYDNEDAAEADAKARIKSGIHWEDVFVEEYELVESE